MHHGESRERRSGRRRRCRAHPRRRRGRGALAHAAGIDAARRHLGRLVPVHAGGGGVEILASGGTGGVGVWPAALAGTTASLLYGVGLNLVRRYLPGSPAGAVAAAALVSGSVLLAPLAIYLWPHHAIPPGSWV